MTRLNPLGLDRPIPSRIKREVRQRSKFGCVVCRAAVAQYEHITPFIECSTHSADNICLLCGACHDKVTRGRLSKETVAAAYRNVQNSVDIKPPFEELDLTAANPEIWIGKCLFRQVHSLIRVDEKSLFCIEFNGPQGSVPSLSGNFYDSNGQLCLEIERNVWSSRDAAWDVKVEGKVVQIRSGPGEIALEMEINPPGKIKINRLNMYRFGFHLLVENDLLWVGQLLASHPLYLGLKVVLEYVDHGISVKSMPRLETPPKISIVGGSGISLGGWGINIGKGNGPISIAKLHIAKPDEIKSGGLILMDAEQNYVHSALLPS